MKSAFLLTALFLLAPMPLAANDSDASVGLGDVVLTREPRISMESERLTISLSKVTVEYEFLNESDRDITTEVAFPIPPYEDTEAAGGIRNFDNFRLWVDGKEMKYSVEAKAFVRRNDANGKAVGAKRDVTQMLEHDNIDIPSLGHYFVAGHYDETVPDIARLPAPVQKYLTDEGVFDPIRPRPLWEVKKTYHWTQTFPAHTVLRVRHEYSPGFGFEGMQGDMFDATRRAKSIADERQRGADSSMQQEAQLLIDACVAPALQTKIFEDAAAESKADPMGGGYVETTWVDYILTTANSWRTPIKRFDLIVERGPKADMGSYRDDWNYASFCWEGPIKQVDAHRFEVTATNFVPKRELKVLFVSVPMAEGKPDATASTPARPAAVESRRRVGSVGGLILATIAVWWLRRRRAG